MRNFKMSDKRSTGSGFLTGHNIHIVLAGIGKARCELFKRQIRNFGGKYQETYSPDITHILVDEGMDWERLCRILKVDSPGKDIKVVKSLWLSSCIKHKQLLGSTNFEISPEESDLKRKRSDSGGDSADDDNTTTSKTTKKVLATSESSAVENKASPNMIEDVNKPTTSTESTSKQHEQGDSKFPKSGGMWRSSKKTKPLDDAGSDSDYQPSGEEDDKSADVSVDPPKYIPKGTWVCAQAASQARVNYNKHITDKLEAMARTYQNTNDRWRALGYTKAAAALKRHPKEVTSWEEAKKIQGVGDRLADKIWEIVESGELQKLNELSSREEIQAINLFTNIWGAGAHTARMWVQQGFRSLDDIRTKASLTRQQKIGLNYYDELLDRMSREEAGQIEQVVIKAALSVQPGLTVMACGSYRRGKATCGDVDVLITHPDGKSHRGIFHKVLNKLREDGFLTDDLVSQEDNGAQQKYLGVCKLQGENTKHRRLDIIVVPYDEFACATMYFTGSAHFNRSMRHLAGKMGMSLSEHSLNVGVVRKGGEKLNKGTPLPTPTEESIFQHLGLKYRTPEERDH